MVIAHFSKRKSLIYTLSFLVACVLMYVATLYHPPGVSVSEYLHSKGLFRYEFAVAAWVCGALLIVRQIIILNQVIAHGSSAIWAAHDRLYYLNIFSGIFYRSVLLSDILEFELRTDIAARGGVVIRLRNGQERMISTWLLLEPTDAVMARLRAAQSTAI